MTGPRHGPGNPVRPGRRAGSPADHLITLPTAEDTRSLGVRLAPLLRPGDLIVLTGPLGAGKTVLVQGIGAGLGVRGRVVSPTFVIARVHRGSGPDGTNTVPLVHVDAYRLHSLAEVDDLDLDVDTEDSVTVVEWGAGLVEQLADSHLVIELERSEATQTRTARLVPHGGDWAARLAQLSSVRDDGDGPPPAGAGTE